MLMISRYVLFGILLFLSTSFAAVTLLSPTHTTAADGTIEITKLAPGHTLALKFNKWETDSEFAWESISLVSGSPEWMTLFEDNGNYLYFTMEIPRSEEPGLHTFNIEFRNEHGLKASRQALVKVLLTQNEDALFQADHLQEDYVIDAGSEQRVGFSLKNKAAAATAFKVTPGVKKVWLKDDTSDLEFTLAPEESKQVYFTVNVPEEGYVNVPIKVESLTNPGVSKDYETTLTVLPTFHSKFSMIARGFPLIPITMAPFYAVVGLQGF
jgi:hypothetical protein